MKLNFSVRNTFFFAIERGISNGSEKRKIIFVVQVCWNFQLSVTAGEGQPAKPRRVPALEPEPALVWNGVCTPDPEPARATAKLSVAGPTCAQCMCVTKLLEEFGYRCSLSLHLLSMSSSSLSLFRPSLLLPVPCQEGPPLKGRGSTAPHRQSLVGTAATTVSGFKQIWWLM